MTWGIKHFVAHDGAVFCDLHNELRMVQKRGRSLAYVRWSLVSRFSKRSCFRFVSLPTLKHEESLAFIFEILIRNAIKSFKIIKPYTFVTKKSDDTCATMCHESRVAVQKNLRIYSIHFVREDDFSIHSTGK